MNFFPALQLFNHDAAKFIPFGGTPTVVSVPGPHKFCINGK